MGQVDRIPPVSPARLQTQASDGILMRKEGRQQPDEKPKHDLLELHETEEELIEASEPDDSVIELFPEHGLDLTA